jgi:DNA invertase Pin-like site-specific DNA recombinase
VRAVAYVRVSSEQQAESGLSLEHQQQKCRALATVNDFELTEIVIDAGESAASLSRPGMARVLAMVDGRHVEAVVIAKLDRITRSVRDLADLLDRFSRHKVALVSASESLNTETAAGRMVVRLLAVVSEWEREAIGERTRDALSAKRRRGERTGTLPYGWHLDGRQLVPLAGEQDLITLAAECRFGLGYTWKATAEHLNAQGHRNRAGKPWTLHGIRSALTTYQRHREERADP